MVREQALIMNCDGIMDTKVERPRCLFQKGRYLMTMRPTVSAPNAYIRFWISLWNPKSMNPEEDLWIYMYGCIQAFSAWNSIGQDNEDHTSLLLLEVAKHIPDADPYVLSWVRDCVRRADQEELDFEAKTKESLPCSSGLNEDMALLR